MTSSFLGLGLSRLEEPVELAEPVAAAVDVDDVHVVKQAIIDQSGPTEVDVRLVFDNYQAHKTELIKRWPAQAARFLFRFIPPAHPG